VELLVGYSLEEWFACAPAVTTEGVILGIGVKTIAFAVPAAMLVVAVASGLVALRCLRRIEPRHDPSLQRARWMAIAGVMNSVLYSLTILASLAVPAFLMVCETTP
jgi:hypothetical protein